MLFSLFFVVIFLNKKVVIVIAAGEKGGHQKKVILSYKVKNYAPVFLLFISNIFLFSSFFFWLKNHFFLFFWATYVLGTLPLGNLGFWTLDSTAHLIMECQRGQNSIIIELHNSFMELHNSSIILNYGGLLIMDIYE